MRALVLTEYKHLEIAEVPVPEIAPDEVLVRVRACGICGSDVHGYDGSSGRRIPPIIMGHEASGEVAAAGSAVQALKEGDRVTFDSTVYCGKCGYCRRGLVNLCDNRQVLGVSPGEYRRHGAFAEYVAIPQHIVHKLPENVAWEHAAMIEPLAVVVHAVNRTPIALGDTGVVVGTGMIGLLAIQALRLGGCARVIAIDIDDCRLELARQVGADEAINSKNADAPRAVAELTGGRGAHVALEAVGATDPVKTAIACLRKGGALTLIGNITPSIELPLQAVVTRELTLLGSCASTGDYPACIELVARGAIRLDPMITAKAPLEDGPVWFERLYARERGLMKVVLEP